MRNIADVNNFTYTENSSRSVGALYLVSATILLIEYFDGKMKCLAMSIHFDNTPSCSFVAE